MSTQRPTPDRDTTKPAEQQGIFRKFDVRRTDGSSEPGGKHHGCEYFVLDVDHDPIAKFALARYAEVVGPTHPELAADMRRRFGLADLSPTDEEIAECIELEFSGTTEWPNGDVEVVRAFLKHWPAVRMMR